MIKDARKYAQFLLWSPSCVPATGFENNGAELNHDAVRKLLERRK